MDAYNIAVLKPTTREVLQASPWMDFCSGREIYTWHGGYMHVYYDVKFVGGDGFI